MTLLKKQAPTLFQTIKTAYRIISFIVAKKSLISSDNDATSYQKALFYYTNKQFYKFNKPNEWKNTTNPYNNHKIEEVTIRPRQVRSADG